MFEFGLKSVIFCSNKTKLMKAGRIKEGLGLQQNASHEELIEALKDSVLTHSQRQKILINDSTCENFERLIGSAIKRAKLPSPTLLETIGKVVAFIRR